MAELPGGDLAMPPNPDAARTPPDTLLPLLLGVLPAGWRIKDVVGLIVMFIGFVGALVPIPAVVQVVRENKTGKYDISPFIAVGMVNIMWLAILLPDQKPDLAPVIVLNAVNLIANYIYAALFVVYATTAQRRRSFLLRWAATLVYVAVALAVSIGAHFMCRSGGHSCRWSTYLKVANGFTMLVNLLMYASPAFELLPVVRTRDPAGMHVPLIIVFFFLGVFSTWFGVLTDHYVMIACAIFGALFSVLEMALYVWASVGLSARRNNRKERSASFEANRIDAYPGLSAGDEKFDA